MVAELATTELSVVAESSAELEPLISTPAFGENPPNDGEEARILTTPPPERHMALGRAALGAANQVAFTATRWRQQLYGLGAQVAEKIEGTSKKPNIARMAASRLVALSVILVTSGAVLKPDGGQPDSLSFHYDSLSEVPDTPDVSHTPNDHTPIGQPTVDTIETADLSLASAHSNAIEIHDVAVRRGEGSEDWLHRTGFTHEQAHELAYSTSNDAMDMKQAMVDGDSAYWADKADGIIGMNEVKDITPVQDYANTLITSESDAVTADAPTSVDEPAVPAHPPKARTTELEPIKVPDDESSADSAELPQPDANLVQKAGDMLMFTQWPFEYKATVGALLALGILFASSSPIVRAYSKRAEGDMARKRQARHDELQIMWLDNPNTYRQARLDEAVEIYTTLCKKLKGTNKRYYKKYTQIHNEVIYRLGTEAFPFLHGNDLEKEVANIARQLSKTIGVEAFHADDGTVNAESLRDQRPIITRIFKGELPAQQEYVKRVQNFIAPPSTSTESVPLDELLV